MNNGLSGIIPVKNGNTLSYPWQSAVNSLLPICDEVIVCDGGSTDGTLEEARNWVAHEPKLRIVEYPWPVLPTPEQVEADDLSRPKSDPVFLVTWLEFAQSHAEFNMTIHLDADEVLCPKGFPAIRQLCNERRSAWFRRINFWPQFPGDLHTEAPHGTVCGERVVYLGPTEQGIVSDNPLAKEPKIKAAATDEFVDTLRIFHLGFLRNQEAFLKKSRHTQAYIHNCFDPRLRQAEASGTFWTKLSPFPPDKKFLSYPYSDWPLCCRDWLRQQGFNVPP